MKFSTQTDAAMRICLYLEVHRDRLVSRFEIAHAIDLGEATVQRLLAELAVANVVEARRGRYGGTRLARQLQNLNVAELIALGESEGWQFTECDRRADCNCLMAGDCTLNTMFRQFQAGFMQMAEGWSMADLLNDNIVANAERKAREWKERNPEEPE